MNHIPAPLFPLPETTISQRIVLTNIIEDKWSKYTVVADLLTDEKAHKSWISELKKDKYFRNATHNSYAWRVKLVDGSIIESSNDDGETWAGQIILREMQRVNATNIIIVVTRYFWWVMLYGDRFRHIVDATKKLTSSI
jgi:putative IMPACT (imprinted ancient) family translation regulator